MKPALLAAGFIILLSAAFLSAGMAIHEGEKIKVTLEVDDRSGSGQYAGTVEQALTEALTELTRYRIVPKAEAQFLLRAQLVSASEIIVDNLPTADVGFLLRLYEINPETGKPGLGVLINSMVTKQLAGTPLEQAIRSVVKGTTINSLEMFRYRFDFPPRKKASMMKRQAVREDIPRYTEGPNMFYGGLTWTEQC